MNVGANIKSLRLQKGMTQKELGDKVGVSDVLISQFERGSKSPNIVLSKTISKVLNCSLDDLTQ